jgi:hypothetical protein
MLFLFPGHYVPQLAQRMVEFNKKEKLFNLKGIAVSKPLASLADQRHSDLVNKTCHFFLSLSPVLLIL